jgi:hypothetical protein
VRFWNQRPFLGEMTEAPNDSDLLRAYVSERADEPFAGLVRRHIGLVYRSALRQLARDAHTICLYPPRDGRLEFGAITHFVRA